jgi:hypothetical protein
MTVVIYETETFMKGKILLVAGLAIGYVLGARAGRARYDELKSAANKLWNDPRVQRPVAQAEDFVKDRAPEVAEFVSDGVKRVVSQVRKSTPTPAKKPATRKPTSTTRKPATPK